MLLLHVVLVAVLLGVVAYVLQFWLKDVDRVYFLMLDLSHWLKVQKNANLMLVVVGSLFVLALMAGFAFLALLALFILLVFLFLFLLDWFSLLFKYLSLLLLLLEVFLLFLALIGIFGRLVVCVEHEDIIGSCLAQLVLVSVYLFDLFE